MQTLVQRPAASRPAPHQAYQPQAAGENRQRGLYQGEPATCQRSAYKFAFTLVHLGMLVALFKVYRLENQAFLQLTTLALIGLPVHYLAPYRWKKPLQVAISIIGLTWVFGPVAAAATLTLSAVLIGICFLPLSWTFKAVSMGAIAITLAIVRPERIIGNLPVMVWPVIATMFMFRMIIFLYEMKHAKKPETLVDALNYFFLLPNYCFLHFPVVDYRTLQRGYFAKDVHETQFAGLRMMTRGTLHLLLYRLVYLELLIPAEEVQDSKSLALYLVCNYLLYLRVSGQFHVACGMLHLFGFQLPETHHNFLLATGFTDYWRRINIYWKDFMVRVVFNPVVFRLKRWPQPVALAVATAVVFVVTWSLHAYQSFWLRGTWGFSVPDALFWGILGILVMINVELDAWRPRGRKAKNPGSTLASLGLKGVKIAGTLTTIVLLWSLWSSPSLSAWFGLMERGLTLSM